MVPPFLASALYGMSSQSQTPPALSPVPII
jgi:hypothetical protein